MCISLTTWSLSVKDTRVVHNKKYLFQCKVVTMMYDMQVKYSNAPMANIHCNSNCSNLTFKSKIFCKTYLIQFCGMNVNQFWYKLNFNF